MLVDIGTSFVVPRILAALSAGAFLLAVPIWFVDGVTLGLVTIGVGGLYAAVSHLTAESVRLTRRSIAASQRRSERVRRPVSKQSVLDALWAEPGEFTVIEGGREG